MAEVIRLIEETEVAEEGLAPAVVPSSMPQPIDPQIIAAIQTLNARLTAAESAVQAVPKAIGRIATLSRALGARALMFVALVGCLGLAGAAAYQPSWQGLGIFGAFAVLVYLPLAYLASRGN